jgi:uncharacterized protein (UPF0371 family)
MGLEKQGEPIQYKMTELIEERRGEIVATIKFISGIARLTELVSPEVLRQSGQ